MKKDIELEQLKVSSRKGATPEEIRLDEEDEERLQREVRSLFQEDVLANAMVRDLLKTPETFSRSCGNLYSFLKDREICATCRKGLSSCPKKRSGFAYGLRYDVDRDEIRLDFKACSYQAEKQKAFDHIDPKDVAGDEIYRRALLFQDLVENRPEMKEVLMAYTLITKSAASPGKYFRAMAFSSKKKDALPSYTLAFACYYFARNGISCAYVDLKKLFASFRDRDFTIVNQAKEDLVKAGVATALFVEGIDSFDYIDRKMADDYLFPLLQSRNQEGKITFSTLLSGNALKAYRKVFYDSDYLDQALVDVETLAREFCYSDFLV